MILRRAKTTDTANVSHESLASVDSVLPINPTLSAALARAQDQGFTGSVQVARPDGRKAGEIFFYEGRIYATEVEGFQAGVPNRLVSAGILTQTDADMLAEHVKQAGSFAEGILRWELASVDSLAIVHQEFVVAGVGALLLIDQANVNIHTGRVTALLCTLPLDVPEILVRVGIRYRRMAQDAAKLTRRCVRASDCDASDHPGSIILTIVEDPVPSDDRRLQPIIPEMIAVCDQVDSASSLDRIAYMCGLTRAEVVHIARSLVEHGLAKIHSCGDEKIIGQIFEHGGVGIEERVLLVPEECSSGDWSLASIAVPLPQGEGELHDPDNLGYVTFSPSHEMEPTVIDSEGEATQNLSSDT